MAKKPAEEPSLDDVLKGVNAKHGSGSVMLLGETAIEPVEVFSTGSIALDEALAVGGFPRGRVIEIYGPESSGKTSLALTAAGNAQRQGLNVAFIDAEHALDPEWADTLGVDTDPLAVSQPSYGEQALQIVEELTKSAKFGLIIVDSVAALVPKAELDGEMGDTHVALQARMMSQALRKLTPVVDETKTTVIFINQLRDKVGVFFGSAETQPGGKALKFYSSVRLDVRRIATIKDKDQAVGSRVKVKVVKNKVGKPFKSAEFDFLFSCGISHEGELLDLGVERKVVRKSGAWYVYGGENIGNGKEAARRWLADNPSVTAALEAAVREAKPAVPAPATGRGRAGGLAGDGDASWDTDEGPWT